ncbi:hypothetical protein [Dysgonomonas sp. 511]|uniref:LIC_10190 family membrane protein n=1 Tax=Dysgonomonas sp. 511 TaxID=2302930 RepID=UPI0013D1FEFB|nr:hypothetical protein [Dysgonomonas sp. 511]NDV80169.1 hypothetical protein [Dysgonomonas sp. 511]
MVVVFISWIIISFVVLSFGSMLVHLVGKLSHLDEKYNAMDTFLLGTCLIAAILSLTSLWLPSNHYMLLAFILIAVIYWIVNKDRLKAFIARFERVNNTFSNSQKLLLAIPVFALLIYLSWASHVFDAAYYHYQNIHWNEDYAVVPGLANLESRFGFNSNFLLVSAIFTFRFILGEAIYTFQSVPIVLLMLWIFVELVRSNFEIKRVVLLILFFLFFAVNVDYICDSSTDIIPNTFVFYLAARLVLYPDMFRDSRLLYFIIPVSLFTFKVSSAPICIVAIGIFVWLLKEKDFRVFSVFTLLALLVVVPWIIRTIIITGYLFYPLPEIDVFSFDWKLDKAVAEFESWSLQVFAHGNFRDFITFRYFMGDGFMNNKLFILSVLIMMVMVAATLISPFGVIYKTIKKKYLPASHYLMYIALFAYAVYWYAMAPDFRFANGAFFGMAFLLLSVFVFTKDKYCPKFGRITLILFASLMLLSSFKRIYNFYKLLYPTSVLEGRKSMFSALYMPYGSIDQAEARHIPTQFSEYPMGDVTIYITADTIRGLGGYDKLPVTSLDTLKAHSRGPDIRTVTSRGHTLQEGFRPKGNE